MSGKKKYSNEFKFQIVQEYLKGKNGGFRVLAAKYGIDYSQIRKWVHLYKEGGKENLTKVQKIYSGDFKG
ncbi:MAG: helix-turn-helix domain-containing protein, partial [Firmicutes bacterium]|nr:helix-turn-helix domain-containing protein [Bacillota bacterium]